MACRCLMNNERHLPRARRSVHHTPDLCGKYTALNLDLHLLPGRHEIASVSRTLSKPGKHLIPLAVQGRERLAAFGVRPAILQEESCGPLGIRRVMPNRQ